MKFGERINTWLSEAPGEQFKQNKWKFWFVALIAFSILNAALTALVFNAGGVLQTYMGTVLLGVGALLAWLGVCALYYSDSTDAHLSRGVAILDSTTLLFVVAHFSFLMWVYGHLSTLQNAEADYKVAVERFNADALKVQASNARIIESLREIEASAKEKAKIEQDTAYQLRQAAKHGAQIKGERSGVSVKFEPAKVELAEPPAPPADSSADYLTRWDSAIRLANFGELALAIFTLIFIRVRSSLTNSPRVDNEFPHDLDVENRQPRRRGNLQNPTTHVSSKNERHSRARNNDTGVSAEGLKILRDTLKLIAFHNPPMHFKTDVKPDCIWIRSMTSDHGIQRTASAAKAKLDILNDAMRMEREAFRERLEKFLRENGFEI
ncbi:MAG: DUF1761 domain-containing protein [Blastocatellia bacterium]